MPSAGQEGWWERCRLFQRGAVRRMEVLGADRREGMKVVMKSLFFLKFFQIMFVFISFILSGCYVVLVHQIVTAGTDTQS